MCVSLSRLFVHETLTAKSPTRRHLRITRAIRARPLAASCRRPPAVTSGAVAHRAARMGAIHKIGVAASLLLMVHATLCAIQRAPPRRLPSSPSLLTSDAPRRRSGLSEVDSRVIHDATRRGALRSRPACVPAHSDKRWSCCHRLSSSACLQPWVGSGACSGSRAAWCPFGRRRPSQSRPWTRCFLAWTSCTSTRGNSGNLVGVAPDSPQREGT